MYLVTTRTPTKSIAAEYWLSELRAYLRADVINATTDENTGAVVEEVIVPDVESLEAYACKVEYRWPDTKRLSGISCCVDLTPSIFVECGLEVRLDISGDDVLYEIDLVDTVYHDENHAKLDIQLNRKTIDLLHDLISEDADEKEYFHQHESEEVTEFNRRSFDDSHPEPKTI